MYLALLVHLLEPTRNYTLIKINGTTDFLELSELKELVELSEPQNHKAAAAAKQRRLITNTTQNNSTPNTPSCSIPNYTVEAYRDQNTR